MEKLADRYELGDALGQGRSTVFRAVDSRLRREVAIKRVQLLAGQEDADQVRTRALREAQASARLNNPAVVTVYDVVEEDGAIWLVMELVAGPSLSQVVADEGPLPDKRAAAIALGVLTALEAAHLVGVVHRDVKPANVLVTEGDRAKLTDFGVATIRDESRVTATGLIVGSPSYMAPEQATGGEITASTDLWALGAMLYFSVEGLPPFQAGSALATASAVVHGEPRPQQNRGQLTPVIDRLLVKDPAARARAGEIRAALMRIARDDRRRPRLRRDPSAGATQLMPVTPQAFTPASSTPSPPASESALPPTAAPRPTPAPTPPAPAPAPMPTPVVESAPATPGTTPAPRPSARTSDPMPEPSPSALTSDPMPEPGSSGRESGSTPEPEQSTAESGHSGESATEPVPGVTPETDPATEPEPSVSEPGSAAEPESSVSEPGSAAEPESSVSEPGSAAESEPSVSEPGSGSEPEPSVSEPAPTLVEPAGTSAPTAVSASAPEPADHPSPASELSTGAEQTSGPDPTPAATSDVVRTSEEAASAEPVATPSPRPVSEPTGEPSAPPRTPARGDANDPAAGGLTPERRRLVLVAAGVVALLLAAVVIPALGDDDQAGRDPTPTTAEPAPANESPPPDDTTVPETTETTEAPTTTTTEPTGSLPEGWAPYADPQGTYTIGLPPGWRVQPTSEPTRVDLVDPATDSFLRIEWVEPPNGDPVGVWQSSATRFAANNGGYEQIRIEPVGYRDYDAAMWEFRHDSGPVLHTGNLGFVTNGRGYALMLRTPEDRWAASQPLFEQFKQAFQPT